MYDTLEIERAGKVATIWMNRPAVLNAFDEQLIAELAAACEELDLDASVRVVVLAGRGKHFSAGADLNWMKRASQFTHEQNVDDARKFAGMLRTLSEMSKPTIARVQGAALGGGTGLTAACDMAIASDDAVFSTSEVKFGQWYDLANQPNGQCAIGADPLGALEIAQCMARTDGAQYVRTDCRGNDPELDFRG